MSLELEGVRHAVRVDCNCPPNIRFVQANRLPGKDLLPRCLHQPSRSLALEPAVSSVRCTRTLACITITLGRWMVVGPREIFAEPQTPWPKLNRYPAHSRSAFVANLAPFVALHQECLANSCSMQRLADFVRINCLMIARLQSADDYWGRTSRVRFQVRKTRA